MSDNKDLKSKILLMRQKNFGEIINDSDEKNDNEKPENAELNHDKTNDQSNEHTVEVDKNIVQEEIKQDLVSDISELKENLSKVAKTNEKAFDLLANKFNESVEVILELTQRVEKLETVAKLQSMQESVKKTEIKPNQKGIKFFIFLIFLAGISYFLYKYNIDISILKEIGKDFLEIIRK